MSRTITYEEYSEGCAYPTTTGKEFTPCDREGCSCGSGKNKEVEKEMVNHPDHYKGNKFEVIDIIEDYNLDFCLGNAIKYILRCGKKDNDIQELEKAKWYLDRRIAEIRYESE